MKRPVIPTAITALAVFALVWTAPARVRVSAQAGGAVPRMADGHPDLSGVWWGGGDVGAAGGRGPVGRGARGGPPPATFQSLYKPEAAARAKTLGDKDDPTLRCTPTAFGTLNVSLWDVGAVGQIVATPKMVVMLTETYHGFRLVPTDGRAHRDDQPPAFRGESVGRWDGDTFVVDTVNFTDNTWISAEGRVSPHSDQLHVAHAMIFSSITSSRGYWPTSLPSRITRIRSLRPRTSSRSDDIISIPTPVAASSRSKA